MYTFSAMILATSIINTAMELYDASTTYQKVHTTKMLIEQRRKALREKRPPNLPMQVEYIHGIVDAGHYFENRYKMPRQTWENISQIFVQHTHLKLKSLNWKVKYKNTLNEQAQTIDNQKSKMTQRFFEVVTLEGEVIDFRGDYIQATLLVRRFLEALRQKKQLFYQVKEILTPFEANRQQLLRGQLENSDTTNLATIKYRAPFTIEILVEHHGKTK